MGKVCVINQNDELVISVITSINEQTQQRRVGEITDLLTKKSPVYLFISKISVKGRRSR